MPKKRIFIALLILILLIVGGFTVYYLYYKEKQLKVEKAEGEAKPSIKPQEHVVIIDSKLRRISAEPAVSPVASVDGTKVVYIGKTGGLFEVGFDGANQKEAKFVTLPNLIKALWAKDRNELVGVYDSAEGKKMFYYNVKAGKTAPYEKNVAWISFSKTENKIAYHVVDALQNTSAIFVAEPNAANQKTVLNTRLREVRLEWVDNDDIAMTTAPSGLAANVLWVVNTNTQKISSVLSNVYGLTTKWDPLGEKVIFSQTTVDGKNLSFSVANRSGSGVKNLGLATLPEKCVFTTDGKSVVCAAPKIAPDLVWPDDYYKKLYNTQEQIWRVNLTSSKRDLLYEFDAAIPSDAVDLVLSPKEDLLVFVNKKDGSLYSLMLK